MSEPEITKRGPGRPSLRKDESIRAPVSDSLARAQARVAELRDSIEIRDEASSKFDIPLDLIPEGWSYEWKMTHTLGKEFTNHIMDCKRRGWSEVSRESNPRVAALFPPNGGDSITHEGLILMERPLVLTEEANRRNKAEYDKVLADKRASLGETPAGTMPRDADNRVRPKVDMKYEQVDIPSE